MRCEPCGAACRNILHGIAQRRAVAWRHTDPGRGLAEQHAHVSDVAGNQRLSHLQRVGEDDGHALDDRPGARGREHDGLDGPAERCDGDHAGAHAGEEGPTEYIWEALDLLKIDRLDHGNRALEDEVLVQKLVQMDMALTICPLSNLKLCVVKNLHVHPLKTILNKGLKATVNSDDPSYFGGYINDNFISIAKALNLEKSDLITLVKNSIDASFLESSQKSSLVRKLDQYIGKETH